VVDFARFELPGACGPRSVVPAGKAAESAGFRAAAVDETRHSRPEGAPEAIDILGF